MDDINVQLNAWRKAIATLDGSEAVVRDLIEKRLFGYGSKSTARVLIATRDLCADIAKVRTAAIKTAFRMLRDKVGDAPIMDQSLALWAKGFAAADQLAIEQIINSSIAEGVNGAEISRRVVGSMALSGVDGATEALRFKMAHLGQAALSGVSS